MKTIVCTIISVFFLSVSGFTQNVYDVLEQTEDQMKTAVEETKKELSKVREARANPSLLDDIEVEYNGKPTPIRLVAFIEMLDSRTLTVTPWDKKLLSSIDQAVKKSGMGLKASNNGKAVIISVSQMTESQRRAQRKLAGNIAEGGRVSIRNIRREAVNRLKAVGAADRNTGKVNKLTDKYIGKIDALLKQKEQGILEF